MGRIKPRAEPSRVSVICEAQSYKSRDVDAWIRVWYGAHRLLLVGSRKYRVRKWGIRTNKRIGIHLWTEFGARRSNRSIKGETAAHRHGNGFNVWFIYPRSGALGEGGGGGKTGKYKGKSIY